MHCTCIRQYRKKGKKRGRMTLAHNGAKPTARTSFGQIEGHRLEIKILLREQARQAVDTDFYNWLLVALLLVFGFVWAWKGVSERARHARARQDFQHRPQSPSRATNLTGLKRLPRDGASCTSESKRIPTSEQPVCDGEEANQPNSSLSSSSFSLPIKEREANTKRAEFVSFQRGFLFTYILMATADWLQGAYVYRLYSYYGFSRADNGYLFIAGYGSSLLFGTWAGPLADRYGRKICCIMYGVSYSIGCWTKFYNSFGILLIGRLVSGVATSILCSGFESWMASEHQSRGFDPKWIGETFSHMCTLNGLAAIASGFLAEYAVALYGNHPVAPFGLAGVLLFVGTLLIMTRWRENYGDRGNGDCNGANGGVCMRTMSFLKGVLYPLASATRLVITDPQIRLVGALQSLYEGCMYTFVFMWSPALEQAARAALFRLNRGRPTGANNKLLSPRAEGEVLEIIASTLPYGIVFASFMLGSSLGGSLFNSVSNAGEAMSHVDKSVPDHHGRSVSGPSELPLDIGSRRRLSTRQLFVCLFLVSSVAFFIPVVSSSQVLLMASFVAFEVCVGLFWPSLGVLRTRYLPEAQRATIINIFRIPLNVIVVSVLLFQGSMGIGTVFAICSLLLLFGALLSLKLS